MSWANRWELSRFPTAKELSARGYIPVGSGKAPKGVEIVEGPTGAFKRGGPGRRDKWWIGRWYKPVVTSKGIGREFMSNPSNFTPIHSFRILRDARGRATAVQVRLRKQR